MGAQTKVAGTWRDMTAPYIKVSGAWNIAKSAWTKLDGQWRSWFLQGGVLDKSLGGEDELRSSSTPFTTNVGLGTSTRVYSLAIQPDGKIVIGGQFTTFNSASVNVSRIIRLNTDGTLDTTFDTNTGTGANSIVYGIATQSDGKILLGGDFTTFNENTVNRIARLSSAGVLDTTFTTNTGTGANGSVTAIALQSNGQILLGGDFTTFNGTTVNRIVRLNSDGTRDTTFTTNTGTGASSIVNAIAIQPDGKIVIVGEFTTFNGTTVNRIVRLNSDGTRDTTFTTNTGTALSGKTFAVKIQSDDKILVGGGFTTFNGTTVNSIVRLNSDGTRDTTFTTNTGTGATDDVLSIALQSDGKILLGGAFATFNGTTVNRIVRLNDDGTRDTTFTGNTVGNFNVSSIYVIALQSNNKIIMGGQFDEFSSVRVSNIARLDSNGTIEPAPGPNNIVNAIATQSDSKVIIGGQFTTFNGTTVNRIARVNSDGTLDTAFTTNTGTGANGTVNAIALQSDGKILLGGLFTTFNGTTVNRIVRLNSDGTRDTAFVPPNGSTGQVLAFAIQSDDKILVGGAFSSFNFASVGSIIRLNSDGTNDTTFVTNTGTGANSGVRGVTLQSDGKILLGGDFTTFNAVTNNRIVRLNSDGTADTTFTTNTGTGANGFVFKPAVQSDGKILLGGQFTTFNGATVNRIVRLNSDGTSDTAFTTTTGTGANSGILAPAVQLDDKIVLGGDFTTFNGVIVGRIIRLNSDGTIDTGFNINIGVGINSQVLTVVVQSDAKITVGGQFTAISGTPRFRFARIGGALAQ